MSNQYLLLVPFAAMSMLAQAQQTVTGSFVHDGLLREYRLYIPAIYEPGTAVPVVFNLHGYTSDNLQQEFYGDFRPIADTANFIIAHPNGTIDALGNRAWNTFGASTVDDLGFITALLDTIAAEYSVDADRVYSTGMSNGGFMSYDLACFRSDRFAAIASVTGSVITSRLSTCAATHPTPVMQIHGTADATVNFNGGSGVVGIEELVNYWVQSNNCDPSADFNAVPNTSTTDGCTAEHYVYSGGDAGSTVEFFKVIGGGHTWPGAAFTIGVTNQDFSASREIWRFFSQYRLSELQTSISPHQAFEDGLRPFPNPACERFALAADPSRIKQVVLLDAAGRAVKLWQPSSEFLLNGLESGAYVLVVSFADRTQRSWPLMVE